MPLSETLRFILPFEEKSLSYGRNENVQGVLFKREGARFRVLYLHGYGGDLEFWGMMGQEMAKKLECDVLMMDYPGFGKSSGGYLTGKSELMAAAEAGLLELQKNNSLPILIYGASLGSGVAAELAAAHPVAGLILHSPYLNLKSLMKGVMPWYPPFLMRFDLTTGRAIQGLQIPVLILHGKRDSTIQFWQAESLARLNPNAELIGIEGGEHTNLMSFPQYWNSIEKFTAKVISP